MNCDKAVNIYCSYIKSVTSSITQSDSLDDEDELISNDNIYKGLYMKQVKLDLKSNEDKILVTKRMNNQLLLSHSKDDIFEALKLAFRMESILRIKETITKYPDIYINPDSHSRELLIKSIGISPYCIYGSMEIKLSRSGWVVKSIGESIGEYFNGKDTIFNNWLHAYGACILHKIEMWIAEAHVIVGMEKEIEMKLMEHIHAE